MPLPPPTPAPPPSAWSLGQTVRHTPEHAKALADIGVLPRLMELQVAEYSSEDLKVKCKRALKAIVAFAALRDPGRGALRLLITRGEDDGRVLARAEDRLRCGERGVEDGLVVDD